MRTYGGATLAERLRGRPRSGRSAPRREAARGAAAAGLVPDGQTIAIAQRQHGLGVRPPAGRPDDLTVITNSLDVAQVLLDREGIQLVVLGGVVRPRMHSLLGHLTEQACREMRADTLFMGIGAISLERGLMNDYMPEILTDRALRGWRASVVVIADSAKFDLVAPAFVFGLDEVDVIVTDTPWRPTLDVVRERSSRSVAASGLERIRVIVGLGPPDRRN